MAMQTREEAFCQCCKKDREASELIPRYVAVKKKVLNICATCQANYVTYDPKEFIEDGDVVVC